MAATCAATVASNDAMQFTKSVVVPASCKRFKVTLRHVGTLPKAAMGRNFVLGKTADVAAINAPSKSNGGGETTTVNLRWPRSRRVRPMTFSARPRGTRR